VSWGHTYRQAPAVGQQRAQAEKRLAQLRTTYPQIEPITVAGNRIAKTWWGVAWCANLEGYADYANRIGRGRSYVKNGLVLDLKISEGAVTAIVSGTKVYHVTITIDKLPAGKWQAIAQVCAQRIDSMSALVEGKFPPEFQDRFMRQGDGLFPSPSQIHMDCTCPDWAGMCKHIAAALYGVGAKLDADPLLFFTMRGIDPTELIKKSVDEKMKSLLANAKKKSKRAIDDKDVSRIFGL